MTAMPGETMEDVGHTLWLIAQLAKTSLTSTYPMSLRKYIPLPGTVMYEQAVNEYGFDEPSPLEGWAEMPESYMNERSFGNAGNLDLRKRPWLNTELGNYVQRGEDAVEHMNSFFVGKDSDWKAIIENVKTVEDIALEVVNGKTEYPQVDFDLSETGTKLDRSHQYRGEHTGLQRTHATMYSGH